MKMNTFFKYILLSGMALMAAACIKEDRNYAIGENNPETSIYVLRNLQVEKERQLDKDVLSDAKYIHAVVVSNPSAHNFPAKTIAIQNTWRNKTRGLLMQLENVEAYTFGDSIHVPLEGAKLVKTENGLCLTAVNEGNIKVLSRANTVGSQAVSIYNLLTKFSEYESTYVDVTADLEHEPAPGTALKGAKILIDAEQNKVNLFTHSEATFAEQSVAPSATFKAVAYKKDAEVQLRLQSYADMAYPSGRIYAGWPETFESPYQEKTSYALKVVNFPTGPWSLDQSLQGNTAGRDRIVSGKQAIRFQQNLSVSAYLQMNFDLPEGASKVTLWYGAYYTDRSSSFDLEYSQDMGLSWTKIGGTVTDAPPTSTNPQAKQAIFLMNIHGPVRFRINKLGLGTSNNSINNGRLGMDDIAIYKSF
ncbi:DUF5689 domain-containing protein [Sphingobacterium sp. Mn56C]|uniref:DUF5689 domain-containing protein n=1 Tax=Sphingobacterium sp. Mn56C TaxID=3395261 RepID=UPI003BEA7E94